MAQKSDREKGEHWGKRERERERERELRFGIPINVLKTKSKKQNKKLNSSTKVLSSASHFSLFTVV